MKTKKVILPNAVMLGEVASLLAEGRSVVILPTGNSMLPFIIGGKDNVELKMKEPREGDIVLASLSPGTYVLHRIKSLDGDLVTLKGDGNLEGVEHCGTADVCGTVCAILHRSGRRVDCTSAGFARRSARWAALPRTVRRYLLAILRRIV